jgi:predicted transcriptional regulator
LIYSSKLDYPFELSSVIFDMDQTELKLLAFQGFSQREIADKLSCSQTNVKYWLRKYGIKTHGLSGSRQRKDADGKIIKLAIDKIDWGFIQKEYDSGLSYRDLEKKHKIPQCVTNEARKRGLLKTLDKKEAFKRFIDNLSDIERQKHFSHKGNPNGKMGGYRANAGRSEKFHVEDSFGKKVCLQSSYEKRTADILDELKIKWIRPSHLKYDDRKYFPDFYLVDKDIYLDPKNDFLAIKDAQKIQKVCEQNQVKVLVIQERDINKDFFLLL